VLCELFQGRRGSSASFVEHGITRAALPSLASTGRPPGADPGRLTVAGVVGAVGVAAGMAVDGLRRPRAALPSSSATWHTIPGAMPEGLQITPYSSLYGRLRKGSNKKQQRCPCLCSKRPPHDVRLLWWVVPHSYAVRLRMGRDEDLKKLFSKYGDLKDVYIPLNYHTK
jgi:hypothetical protein